MRGLLYKDVVTNKVNIICMGIVFGYLVLSMCVWVGEINKNGMSDENLFLVYNSLLMGIIALNFSFPTLGMEAGFDDIKTKWNTYAAALPGGYKKMVLAKYLLGVIGQAAAVVCSLLVLLVCKIAVDIEIDLKLPVMLMLVTAGGMLMVQAVFMPFMLKNQAGLVKIILGLISLLALYGIFAYIALGDISFFRQDDILFKIITWVAQHENKLWTFCAGMLGAGVLLDALSYTITVRTYLGA